MAREMDKNINLLGYLTRKIGLHYVTIKGERTLLNG